MPQVQQASFQIAHVGPHERRHIAFVRSVLMAHKRLLLQRQTCFLARCIIFHPNEMEQRRAADTLKYHRLAAECRELASILLDQRDDYLRMARTYDAMANGG